MRLLSRRLGALGLSLIRAVAMPFDGDLLQATVFCAVLCSNLSHHPYASPEARITAEGLDALDDGLRRPVSVSALSRFLNLPFETLRRRTALLEEQGLCLRTEAGLVVPPNVMVGAVVREPWLKVHGDMIEVLKLLQRAGLSLEALSAMAGAGEGAPPPEVSPMLQTRIMLDTALRIGERSREAWGGILGAYIIHGVIDANVGYLDAPPHDPLTYAYVSTPPPDGVRRPVGVTALARSLSLPTATTRRWIERLAAGGWLQPVGKEYIIDAATLDAEVFTTVANGMMIHAMRMFVDLRRTGLRSDTF